MSETRFWQGNKCARCQIEFERGTKVETFDGKLLHVGCFSVIKANVNCPYGCGARKYVYGNDFSCISDHK